MKYAGNVSSVGLRYAFVRKPMCAGGFVGPVRFRWTAPVASCRGQCFAKEGKGVEYEGYHPTRRSSSERTSQVTCMTSSEPLKEEANHVFAVPPTTGDAPRTKAEAMGVP